MIECAKPTGKSGKFSLCVLIYQSNLSIISFSDRQRKNKKIHCRHKCFAELRNDLLTSAADKSPLQKQQSSNKIRNSVLFLKKNNRETSIFQHQWFLTLLKIWNPVNVFHFKAASFIQIYDVKSKIKRVLCHDRVFHSLPAVPRFYGHVVFNECYLEDLDATAVNWLLERFKTSSEKGPREEESKQMSVKDCSYHPETSFSHWHLVRDLIINGIFIHK